MPEPGIKIEKKDEEEKIKKMLKATKKESTSTNETSSIEDSILDKIRK